MIGRTLIFAAATTLAVSSAEAQEASHSGLSLAVLGGSDSIHLRDGIGDGSEGNLTYGLSLGYDADLGSAVAGVEAEIADSDVQKSLKHVLLTADRLKLSAGRDIYLGLRGGVRVAPDVLAYAKAGYTSARFKTTYDNGFTVARSSDTLSGFRLGAGVEYTFGRFGLRGEYRYSDYGEYSYDAVRTGIGIQRHQVVVGVIGKF